MKEKIKEFAMSLGVDDVGFASVSDYKSPNSPAINGLFPKAKSIVVLAFRDLDNCESENMQIAFSGRMDVMEFARSSNYKIARFLNRELGAKAMSVSPSYPLAMTKETKGAVGDVSLRHAAYAAGLGTFGRNNLILHPKWGSKVIFTAILTNLELESDPVKNEELCNDCLACVNNCPGGALDEEGKTHLMKCIKNSQPYGIGASIKFWMKFSDSSPEEQKEMFVDPHYWRLYHAGSLGFQYFCFNCMKSCPIGNE